MVLDESSTKNVPKLNVRNDQRIGCLGRTGCGKTFLMERLLEDQPRVIVVDSKHRVNFSGYSMTTDPAAALLDAKTIYRHDGTIPDSFFDDVLTVLQEAGGGILYIDELAEVTTPSFMPAGLRTLFRLGRELGVAVYWSAQAATEVSNIALRQSDLLIMFLNIGASDRDKLIKVTGDLGEATAHLDLYEFVVFQAYNDAYNPAGIPVYKYDRSNDLDKTTFEETVASYA